MTEFVPIDMVIFELEKQKIAWQINLDNWVQLPPQNELVQNLKHSMYKFCEGRIKELEESIKGYQEMIDV